MAKNKVIGIIAAIIIVGGIVAGGVYYNKSKDKPVVQPAIAAQTQVKPVNQVKAADQQIVQADQKQEKQDEAIANKDAQIAKTDKNQAKTEQTNEAKSETVAKNDQAQNNQAQAKIEKNDVQKDTAAAKVDEQNAAKAEAAAKEAKAKAEKEAAAIKAEQAKEQQVTPATVAVGPTNNAIVPNGNIINSAKSYAVPANQVNEMVNGKYQGNQKEIFLTFDDGPSATNTPKVLQELKANGVHATFFVLGSEIQSNADKNIIKEEIMDGNAIADHSYSHDYAKLYPHNSVSVSAFMNEFNATNDILRNVLGKNFNARIVRMPGGYMSRVYYHDKNLPALNAAFKQAGITSVDWNAETGDATGKAYSPSQLVQNAINETKGYKHVVLLMHDIKSNTAAALPQLIQYYKSQGYAFKVISNTGIN